MALSLRARAGAVAAAVALTVPLLPCTGAAAATGTTPSPMATSTAAPGPSVPSQGEVSEAQKAAAAAAEEVADITAEVERAEARLEVLQRGVADAVSAQERAEQQLADADAAVQQATEDLAAARRTRDAADRALSGRAALIYMQGGDLENLTTLLLSPPDVMSDLAVVLDQNAHQVRQNLDAATMAAVDAASRERLLTSARNRHAVALAEASAKRAAAEKQAATASAEAARLGTKQEELTARLAELEQGAADLAALREAAARLDSTALLGVQAFGAPGSGPRAAQEIARSMLAAYDWDDAEFLCLVQLWNAESAWSWSATNPSSGAYGIPQALPGWKMGSAGGDWLTNPATQITWGMGYIESVYGSPCSAYDQFLARSPHWY